MYSRQSHCTVELLVICHYMCKSYTSFVVQVGVIALMIGTLWLQLEVSASNARSFFAVCFMSIMFLAMGQIPQQHVVQATKPVFFKQRDNFFYHGGAVLFFLSFLASLARWLLALRLRSLHVFCTLDRTFARV